MLVDSRYLSHDYKKIIDPVIQRNLQFAHPENVIWAITTGHQPHIRELGLRRVIKAWVLKQSEHIRKFKAPAKLNFDATEYFEMIDCTDVAITEPPVIKTMTGDDFRQFIAIQMTPIALVLKFSCHTQAVERVARLVTEASKPVCRQKSADVRSISDQITSAQLMPTFEPNVTVLISLCNFRIF